MGRIHAHAMVKIGAHVDHDAPLAAAAELGAEIIQIFNGKPQGWEKPPQRADAAELRESQARPLHPRPLPDQRLLAEAERPLRLAQDPPAAVRRGSGARGGRADRPPRPRRGRDRRGRPALGPHARDARDRGARLPREHGGRRQRGRPQGRRAGEAVGGRHGRRGPRGPARLLLRHLSRPRRGRGPLRRRRAHARDHRPRRPGPRQRLARPARDRRRPPRKPRRRARWTPTTSAT